MTSPISAPSSPAAPADNTAPAGAAPKRTGNVTALIIASAHRTLAGAAPQNRLKVFGLQAEELFAYVRKGAVDHAAVVDALQAMAEEHGIVDLYGQDHVQSLMAAAAADTGTNATAGSSGDKHSEGRGRDLVCVCASDVTPKPTEWFWPGRIARGKQTMIGGDPEAGKSTCLASIVAKATTGGLLPGGEHHAPVGNVIILQAEDGIEDTCVPRLIAAGADLKRVFFIGAVKHGDNERSFNLATDLDALEAKINEVGNVVLVIIDPISSYLGKTDSHKNAELRGVLEPVGRLAERTNVAVVSITHFNKALAGQNGKTIYRFIGSIGFIAAARAAFVVIEDPEDSGRSFFLHAKNNLAPPPPGLAFRKTQTIIDGGIVTSLAEWDLEPVVMTANQAMGESKDSNKHSATDEIEEFLREVLAIEPRPVTEIEVEARGAGFLKEGERIRQNKPFRGQSEAGDRDLQAARQHGRRLGLETPEGALTPRRCPSKIQGTFGDRRHLLKPAGDTQG
jgi:putative DNA primase/helicase